MKADPPVMLDESVGSIDQLDIKQLLLSVYEHKWSILILGLVFALGAAFYANTLTPMYSAQATLLIDREEANVVSIQDVYTPGYKDWDYLRTQYELLKSRDLAERVVRKLELYNHPKFAPKKTDESDKEEEAGWFDGLDLSFLKPAEYTDTESRKAPELTEEEKREQRILGLTGMVSGGVSINPVNDSWLVAISFKSDDPRLAADIVNTLADQYIESYLDARLGATRKASEWLNVRLADLKSKLKASEEKLQAFREREKLVDLQGITTIGAQQLRELSEKYSAARQARIAAENIRSEVARLGNASIDDYLTIPSIQRHEAIRDLRTIEADASRKVAELGKRYGVKHPRLIAAKSELNSARQELASEVRKIVTGIEREYQVALRNEQALAEQMEDSKADLRDINRKEFEVQELEREVETNRQLYDLFFTRIKETNQAGGFERANARIIDEALVPAAPFSPNVRMIILAGLMGGLMLGSAVAVLIGFLDNTVKSPSEVKSKLNATLLGTLPLLKPDDQGNLENYWQNQQSRFAESIRTVRTSLVLSGLDKPLKVLVITSSVPGEGKSSIALNLGAAFAQMEKTLVIGADLRRPTIASKTDMSPKHPGLSNYVAGSADLEECIVKFGNDELYVMAAGLIPPNPLEMLSSRRFREALDSLSEQYDRIVIDSAPLQAVSDALILSTYADSMLYVVRADDTSATVAKRGLEQLTLSNTPIAGVILNGFDPEKSSKYYSGDYNYDYYYQADEAINARR